MQTNSWERFPTPPKGQQSLSQMSYPAAWEHFINSPETPIEKYASVRRILMNDYGLGPDEAGMVLGEFIQSQGAPRLGMALDPGDMQRYISEKGPYLYHWTKPEKVPGILREGLRPAYYPTEDPDPDDMFSYEEEYEPPGEGDLRRNWDGFVETRPHHVYLATPEGLVPGQQNDRGDIPYQVPVRVDLRKIDPNKLKADEDVAQQSWESWTEEHPDPEYREYLQEEGLPPPSATYWEPETQGLGGWAEETGLDDPWMTNESLGSGALAHEGEIPPSAISLHPDYLDQYPNEAHQLVGGQLPLWTANRKPTWVSRAAKGPTPCAVEIGDPQREIEVQPLRPPVPLPAPEPTPEPQRQPVREPEREPAKVGAAPDDPQDQAGNLYTEPLHGERTLYVEEVEGGIRLASGGFKHTWQPGVAAVATCGARNSADHDAPHMDCSCGFYTVDADHISVMEGYTHSPYVIVDLSLWGRIEEHSYGQRSQYAYPYEIRVPPGLRWFNKYSSEEIAKLLAQTYQVDTKLEKPPWTIPYRRLPVGWKVDPNTSFDWEGMKQYDFGNGWAITELDEEQAMHLHETVPNKIEQPRSWQYDDMVTYGVFQDGKPKGFIEGWGDPSGLDVWEIQDIGGAENYIEQWFAELQQQGSELKWDKDSPQAMDESYPYTDEHELLDSVDDVSVDDYDDLMKVYEEIERSPSQFSETTPDESYEGPPKVEHGVDNYGLTQWAYQLREYPPTIIRFPFEAWYNIALEAITDLVGAGDPETAWQSDDLEGLGSLAQALYVVPAFIVSSDAQGWSAMAVEKEDWQENIKKIPQTIDELEQHTIELEGFNPETPPQNEQLFETGQWQVTPQELQNQTVKWFLDYLRKLFGAGYRKDTYPPSQYSPQGWTHEYYENDPKAIRRETPAPGVEMPPFGDKMFTPNQWGGGYQYPNWDSWYYNKSKVAETVMDPGVIQDFDFDNWTVTDPGWRSYLVFHTDPNLVEFYQNIMTEKPEILFSPMGISWEEARDWLKSKFVDSIKARIDEQAVPGQPFQMDTNQYCTIYIEKIHADYRNSKVAKEGDPEFSFMYYKSALEVVPWSHNVRYREIAQRLLNKFNTRLEDGGWKDDEGSWAGGDIFREDGGLRVEFKHLAEPDIQTDALYAIKAWWKDQPREDRDIEWEMKDEEHLDDDSSD